MTRNNYPCITIVHDKSSFSFLPEGDCLKWLYDSVRINAFQADYTDGAIGNIYLRIRRNEELVAYPLLGLASGARVHTSGASLIHSGKAGGISYEVAFRLAGDGIWFQDIRLHGNGEKADLIFTQDIAVGAEGSVLSNELYLAQYLGHTVFQGPWGYVVCSRQNMSQGGTYPYLQLGSAGIRSIAFGTDGTQFFGLSYKKTNRPEALSRDLPSRNKQFELSQISLQTEPFTVTESFSCSFYGICRSDHPAAVTELEYQAELNEALPAPAAGRICISSQDGHAGDSADHAYTGDSLPSSGTSFPVGRPYASPEWDHSQVDRYFPERILEEKDGQTLLSFFTPDSSHVVLQSKELLTERPHGHILISDFDLEQVPRGVLSSTNYMYGIFHCQIVVGNTNMNKLLSNHRGLLNTQKNSGLRLYVRFGGAYRLLTLPAAYQMSPSQSVWYYQLEDDVLTVRSFMVYRQSALALQVSSAKNRSYDILLTGQLASRTDECAYDMKIQQEGNLLRFTPADPDTREAWPYHFGFRMRIPHDSIFCAKDSRDPSLFTVHMPEHGHFEVVIQGYEEEEPLTLPANCDAEAQLSAFEKYYETLTAGFHLTLPEGTAAAGENGAGASGTGNTSAAGQAAPAVGDAEAGAGKTGNTSDAGQAAPAAGGAKAGTEGSGTTPAAEIVSAAHIMQKLNTIVLWFAHDALVHFASPHGLEQSGGAAWGTRDICQGPIEFFLSTGHTKLIRSILLNLFSHQLADSYEWPQWFMFDNYNMHQAECHGDIVFWPLKAVGDYIQATGDLSLFAETVDYRESASAKPAHRPEPILTHIRHAIESIRGRYLPGTALISYAGGDWDDTLQPANAQLKKYLVSAWTQALAAQTLRLLAGAVQAADEDFSQEILRMAGEISDAFQSDLIADGVIAGFLYRESPTQTRYMLHPLDTESPIHYRLLPLTRSIIARLASPDLAKKNMELIDTHLACPDGVRLMDHPANYQGGISTTFLRAEQAANVGREISLQYVHAHIRYIEAAAAMGDAKRAWDGLMRVNPILLAECVPNACRRQSNVYFSSSDGCFLDRYDYASGFERLRTGDIPVKGGWRLYSSGPGIYLRRLIAELLGIRPLADSLCLDPVLSPELDGAELSFSCFDTPVRFVYHLKREDRETPEQNAASGETAPGLTVISGGTVLSGTPAANPYRRGGIEIPRESFLKAAAADPVFHLYL